MSLSSLPIQPVTPQVQPLFIPKFIYSNSASSVQFASIVHSFLKIIMNMIVMLATKDCPTSLKAWLALMLLSDILSLAASAFKICEPKSQDSQQGYSQYYDIEQSGSHGMNRSTVSSSKGFTFERFAMWLYVGVMTYGYYLYFSCKECFVSHSPADYFIRLYLIAGIAYLAYLGVTKVISAGHEEEKYITEEKIYRESKSSIAKGTFLGNKSTAEHTLIGSGHDSMFIEGHKSMKGA